MSQQTVALLFSLAAMAISSVLVLVSNHLCLCAARDYAKARKIAYFTGAAAVRDAAASWSLTPDADVVSYMDFYADSLEAEARELVADQ